MMVVMSKLRPGGAMLRTTSIQRAKMAQVRMGSIAMRPEETRKYAPKPPPRMGPKATTPRMGKRMMRAASSPPPPLRRQALRKMHQRSLARAGNSARVVAAVQGWVVGGFGGDGLKVESCSRIGFMLLYRKGRKTYLSG